MPRRARTRRRTLDDLVTPPSIPADECTSVPIPLGTGVAMRCQGDCPRCAAYEKEYADAAPERERPAASTEALAGLVSRVNVKAPAWPAVRADLNTALADGRIADPDVRRDLAQRLRALPAAPIDTYPEEDL